MYVSDRGRQVVARCCAEQKYLGINLKCSVKRKTTIIPLLWCTQTEGENRPLILKFYIFFLFCNMFRLQDRI